MYYYKVLNMCTQFMDQMCYLFIYFVTLFYVFDV